MEIKSELLQADVEYVQENSLKCSLFIHSEAHLSRMAVVDEENKIRIVQEKTTEDILKDASGLLNLRFEKTYVVVNARKVRLFPEELYDKAALAETEFGDQGSPSVYTTAIARQRMIAEFQVHENENFWLTIWKDAELIPSFAVLINHLSELVRFKTVAGIQFHGDYMELSLFQDNHLILYNQFPTETPDEFNFFLLTLFQKYDLTPALVQFSLWGNVSENDDYYARIAKYSRNISLSDSPILLEATTCVS
jgi:hypothetical protein